MTENAKKMCFIFSIEISTRHVYGHYLIPHTQKHGYRHQNRDSSFARGQVMAKYVISMAAILNVP